MINNIEKLSKVLNPNQSLIRPLSILEEALDEYYNLHKQLETNHRLLISQLN